MIQWKSVYPDQKLTRPIRAELLGVSVRTADRILTGEQVDRSSLQVAFACVGLILSDELLEFETPTLAVVQSENAIPRKRFNWKWIVLTAGVLVLVVLSANALRQQNSIAISPLETEYARINALTNSGIAKYHAAQFDEAEKLLKEAAESARLIRNASQMATAYKALAEVEMFRGNYKQAGELLAKSYSLWDTLKINAHLPPIQQLQGQVCQELGQNEMSMEKYLSALKGFESENEHYGMAMVQADLAQLCVVRKQFREAEAWLVSSQSYLRKRNHAAEVAATDLIMGELESAKGHHQAALQILQKSLGYWKEQNHPRWIAKSYLCLGVVASRMNDHDLSRTYLAIAESKYSTLRDNVGVDRVRKARIASGI